jgi:hypothetical protein
MMSSLDYENEIQFQFHLEIVPSRADGSQQIENAGLKWEGLRDGRRFSRTRARPIRLVSVKVCFRQLAKQGCTPVAATSGHQWTRSDWG